MSASMDEEINTAATRLSEEFDAEQEKALREIMNKSLLGVFEQKHTTFTELQIRACLEIFADKNVRFNTTSGSGKSLAITLAALLSIGRRREQWKINEIGVMILTSTIERAKKLQQCMEPYAEKMSYIVKTAIGGQKNKSKKELEAITQGCNILISTMNGFEKVLRLDEQSIEQMLIRMQLLIVDQAEQFTIDITERLKIVLSFLPVSRKTALFYTFPTRERKIPHNFAISDLITIEITKKDLIVASSSRKTIEDPLNLETITLSEGNFKLAEELFNEQQWDASNMNFMPPDLEEQESLQVVEALQLFKKLQEPITKSVCELELYDVVKIGALVLLVIETKEEDEKLMEVTLIDTDGNKTTRKSWPKKELVVIEESHHGECEFVRMIWKEGQQQAILKAPWRNEHVYTTMTDTEMALHLMKFPVGKAGYTATVELVTTENKVWFVGYTRHRVMILK